MVHHSFFLVVVYVWRWRWGKKIWNLCVWKMRRGHLLYSYHPANGIYVCLYICYIQIIQKMEYLYICIFVYLSYHTANGIFVYLYICCIHITQQMEYLYISTQTNCWKLKLVTGWATSIQVQHSLQPRNLGKQDNQVISIMVMVNHLFLSFRFWVNVCLYQSENALEGGKILLKICECVMFPFHPLWTLTKPYICTFILIDFLERCKDAWSKLLAIRIIYSPILPHPQSDEIKLSITGIISATYEIYKNCKISSSGFALTDGVSMKSRPSVMEVSP